MLLAMVRRADQLRTRSARLHSKRRFVRASTLSAQANRARRGHRRPAPRGLPPPPAAVQAAHSAHCSVSEVSGPKVAVEFPHAWVSIEPFRLLRCDHWILRLPLQH